MKRGMLKFAAFALFMTVIGVMTAGLWAEDTGSTPATNPADAPTTRPERAHHSSGASKFYGVISSVDAKAKTFIVDGVTYQLTTDSAMTKAADGSAATMADVTVGQTARGSYHKAHDGTLNVTKVRFGRKSGGKGGKHGGKKSDSTQPDQDTSSN
jgi:hypothetical protein